MAAAAQQNLFNVEDNQANLGRNFATSLIDSAMPLLGSIGGGGGAGAGAGAASTSGSGLNLGGLKWWAALTPLADINSQLEDLAPTTLEALAKRA